MLPDAKLSVNKLGKLKGYLSVAEEVWLKYKHEDKSGKELRVYSYLSLWNSAKALSNTVKTKTQCYFIVLTVWFSPQSDPLDSGLKCGFKQCLLLAPSCSRADSSVNVN